MTKPKIICFLTVTPNELFLNFCKKLKSQNYYIYVVIDNNNYEIKNDDEIIIIQIDNKICEDAGYKNTVTYCKNRACSRDKALYYFCNHDIDYKYIWFIEEDVFIPDVFTILEIDNKYLSGDLLSSKNIIINNNSEWPHTNRVIQECQSKIELPYYKSMVCAVRCSKLLLSYIHEYATNNKTLFFCEVLFNTLAFKNNLEIINPSELSTIIYKYNWEKKDIQKSNLYHPIKDIQKQYEYRI
jgi:hypothetical protein